MSCPCNKNKKALIVHKKGVYVSPPKAKCGDCKNKQKNTTKTYSTKNIRSRKFK
jgi:hypothetical protein